MDARLAWTALLFAPLLAEAAIAQTFPQLCEQRLPRPQLRVDWHDGDYALDTSHSSGQLTGMGAGARKHGRAHVLGLTRTESAATLRFELARLTEPATGRECASPQVEIDLAYRPMTIYVGREFPAGSCAYREILAHELRHVAAYREHLPKVAAALRARLAARFGGELMYGRSGEIERELAGEIQSYWLPLLESEVGKVEAAQDGIDSAEEYARMESICAGEVQRLMEAAP